MAEDEFMEWGNNANEPDIPENMRKVVIMVFGHEKSIEVSSKVRKNFPMGYPDRESKIFLELGTYVNRFLMPENPRVPKISQFEAKIKKLKKLIFLTWGTPG